MHVTYVILAGGYGKRSGNSSLPKALQKVGNQPILWHQLKQISKSGSRSQVILVTGFLSASIEAYVDSIRSEFPLLKILVRRENFPAGTTQAIVEASLEIKTEFFVLILGDVFFEFDLMKLIDSYLLEEVDAVLLSHPNSHPQDSDRLLLFPRTDLVSRIIRKSAIEITPNLASAGICVMRSDLVPLIKENGQDFMEALSCLLEKQSGLKVRTLKTVNYIADSGTPRRLEKIDLDLQKKVVSRRSNPGKLTVFLDLDDTLIPNLHIKNRLSRIEVHDKLASRIKEINELGIPIFIVTNQPGIAKGFFSELDFIDFQANFESKLSSFGAFIDDIVYCPHHPEGGWLGELPELKRECHCRKPDVEMFELLAAKYQIDLSSSFYAGDSRNDLLAAERLSIPFTLIDSSSETNRVNALKKFLDGVKSLVNS